MISTYAVTLAGLACLILQCLAAPLPTPMNAKNEKLNPSSKSQSASSASAPPKRFKTKELLANHNRITDDNAKFMHELGTKKLLSLNEAAKLRQNDLPVHHKIRWAYGKTKLENGNVLYDNSHHFDAVKAVLKKGKELDARHEESDQHVQNLVHHKNQEKVKHALEEAKKMHYALTEGKDWVRYQVQDEGATHEIGKIMKDGYDPKVARSSRGTKDIEDKVEHVQQVLHGVPRREKYIGM